MAAAMVAAMAAADEKRRGGSDDDSRCPIATAEVNSDLTTCLRRRRGRLGSAAADELMSFNIGTGTNSKAYCEYSLHISVKLPDFFKRHSCIPWQVAMCC